MFQAPIFDSFAIHVYLPSNHRSCSTILAVFAYISFLLISVVPVLFGTIMEWKDRRWPQAMLIAYHAIYLNYFITGLNIAAFFSQARAILSQPQHQAMSRTGLIA